MSATTRIWWSLARHTHAETRLPTVLAVTAFAVTTWVVLTVAGGVQAFDARAAAPGAGDEEGTYRFLSWIAVALLVVPTATLGAAAARLTVARRDERLARLRLAGATSGQIGAIALLDAGAQALAGVVAGIGLDLAALPLVARLRFQDRVFDVAELRLGAGPVLAVAVSVLLVALVSSAVSLRRVAITPLGVAQRLPQKGLSWARVLPVLLLGGGFVLAFNASSALFGVGAAFAVLVLVGFLAGAFAVFNLVGPLFVSVLGRVLGARARTVPTLLAARRMTEDPKSVWRSVGGISLVTFVAGCLSVTPGMTQGPEDVLMTDIGTGTTVTLVICAVLAAVSTGVTQASRVLDSRSRYRTLHLAGTDVAVLHAARARETWVPLVVTMGGAAALSLLIVSPVIGLLRTAPVGVLWFAGSAVGAAALVLLAARASRPLLQACATAAPTGIPSR
ncbi:ABC transporter permease family protein [Kineococcus sp. SYSU DK001]|uniref:FtsX-like permease family protein n=1 Tax=Kineococcus sp. SYSU DK001 TaxID=3383122 RepID=UPI003D7D2975